MAPSTRMHGDPVLTPIWRQVHNYVLERFQTRSVVEGEVRLPSVRRIAEQCGVSLASVQRAYRELEQQGLLERLPGKAVVLKPNSSQAHEQTHARLPHLTEGASGARLTVHFQTPDVASNVLAGRWRRVLARFGAANPDLAVQGVAPMRGGGLRHVDVAMVALHELEGLVRRDQLAPLNGLTDLIPQRDLDAIPEGLIGLGRRPDGLWALPVATSHTFVYLNLDLLDRLGVSALGCDAGWHEAADVAVAVGRAARAQGRHDIWGVNLPIPRTVADLADSPNGGWHDPAVVAASEDKLLALWEFYTRFAGRAQACWEGVADTGPRWDDICRDFRTGRLAMMIGASFLQPVLSRSVGFRLGAVPMPELTGDAYWGEVMMLVVGADAPHRVEGGRWIAHLVSRPGQQSLAAERIHVPVNADLLASDFWRSEALPGLEAMPRALRRFVPLRRPHAHRPAVDVLLLRPLVARLFLGEIGVREAHDLFRSEHPRVLASSWG
jgi:DNA-binding transcriptional regulator YhcF (GntR family)